MSTKLKIEKSEDGRSVLINSTALLAYMVDIREYIESTEVTIDGQWGRCRSREELIERGDMPEEWDIAKELISKLG